MRFLHAHSDNFGTQETEYRPSLARVKRNQNNAFYVGSAKGLDIEAHGVCRHRCVSFRRAKDRSLLRRIWPLCCHRYSRHQCQQYRARKCRNDAQLGSDFVHGFSAPMMQHVVQPSLSSLPPCLLWLSHDTTQHIMLSTSSSVMIQISGNGSVFPLLEAISC